MKPYANVLNYEMGHHVMVDEVVVIGAVVAVGSLLSIGNMRLSSHLQTEPYFFHTL